MFVSVVVLSSVFLTEKNFANRFPVEQVTTKLNNIYKSETGQDMNTQLFKLIDWNLPVPTIGNGKNHYQMVSVFDCVDAIFCAIEKGIPNKEYNLGSKDSPNITTLLKGVVKSAGSHSIVIHTPGKLVKWTLGLLDNIGMTIMYPEQFMIADEEYVLDISETEKDLGWSPKYNDEDMLKEAYKMYREGVSK